LTLTIKCVINNYVVMIFTEHVLDSGANPDTSTTDTLLTESSDGRYATIGYKWCIFAGGELGSTGVLGRMELSRSKLG
jgi:hypothetical protein